MKRLKTTHVDYKQSDQPEEIKPSIRHETKQKPVPVTYRGDDLTYGRIETTRKLPSTYKSEQPMAVERITVEEITFPRRTTEASEEQARQVKYFMPKNHQSLYSLKNSLSTYDRDLL